MLKITNDGSTRSRTGCFIATATVGVKGLTYKDDSSESAQRSVTDVRALARYME